jgi:hypothetical protein
VSNEVQNIISNMTDAKRKYETKRGLKKGFGSLVEYLQNKVDVERFQQKNPILTQHAKLCEFLQVKSEEVVPVRIKGLTGNMVKERCHNNVSWLCKRYGGKRVTGWYVESSKECTFDLRHHSVWRTPEGKLVDPTLSNEGRKKGCRFLILDESSYGDLIIASYWNFRKTNKGEWFACSGERVTRISITGESMMRLRDLHRVEYWNYFENDYDWYYKLCNKQKSIGNPIPQHFKEIDIDAKIAA